MAIDSKVVWSEGIFICPQHFQQFERNIDSTFRHTVRTLEGYFWGFSKLELDVSSLNFGSLSVLAVEGVLADGSFFCCDDTMLRHLRIDIPVGTTDEKIFLAWPKFSTSRPEVSFNESSKEARYLAYTSSIYDSTNLDLEPREIILGRLNPILLLESQLTDAFWSLPIFSVQSVKNNKEIVFDSKYIPPILNVFSDINLQQYIEEIYGLLSQRALSLVEHLNNPQAGGTGEIRDLLTLQVINRYIAYFHHQKFGAKKTHPEDLFVNVSKLCADLMTFTNTRTVTNIPEYLHDDLKLCFGNLMINLRKALSVVLEHRAIRIPLELRDESTRVASTPDKALLDKAVFVLAIKADVPSEKLRQNVPSVIKISTVEKVKDLVAYHLPGVKVNALSVAPREMPYHSGYNYFELDKQTELWDKFDVSSGMAIHLAGDFPNLDMEFWAIKP